MPCVHLHAHRRIFDLATQDNCVQNDLPWVAGLRAVLPRLVHLGTATPALVPHVQLAKWSALLASLPPLPTMPSPSDNKGTIFAAAQYPYAPDATHSGTCAYPSRIVIVCSGSLFYLCQCRFRAIAWRHCVISWQHL